MFRKTKRETDRQTNKQTFGAEIGSENKPVGPALKNGINIKE